MTEETIPPQKRKRWPWVVGAVALLVVIANLGGDETPSVSTEPPGPVQSEVDEAFEAAAAVDELQDVNEDLFPAVRACASLAEWSAASAQHPDALDGGDPETVLTNLCQFSPEVVGEPLCSEVG